MSTADTQIGTEGSALSWTDGLDRLREQVDGPVLLGSHAVTSRSLIARRSSSARPQPKT
jgi:hypothetical protein